MEKANLKTENLKKEVINLENINTIAAEQRAQEAKKEIEKRLKK